MIYSFERTLEDLAANPKQTAIVLGVALVVLFFVPLFYAPYLDFLGIPDYVWDVSYLWWDRASRASLCGLANLRFTGSWWGFLRIHRRHERYREKDMQDAEKLPVQKEDHGPLGAV